MPRNPSAIARELLHPRAGLYKVRLVRRGPWVAAEIEEAGDVIVARVCGLGETWRGTRQQLSDQVTDALMDGKAFHHPLLRVSLFGVETTPEEHAFLTARREWALQHDPNDIYARAREPIDIDQLPPLF